MKKKVGKRQKATSTANAKTRGRGRPPMTDRRQVRDRWFKIRVNATEEERLAEYGSDWARRTLLAAIDAE